MLNEAMDQVVLVKGWKKNANWSFPRGKINKDEEDLVCAMREVYEETGFDIEKAGVVPESRNVMSIEIAMREQHIRLFVFRGVPMDTHFEPRTRKEISKIQWWKLSDLPTMKKIKQQQGEARGEDLATNANKFYMVAPFLGPLRRWTSQQKKQDARKGMDGQKNGTSIEGVTVADIDPFTEDRLSSISPRDHPSNLPSMERALQPKHSSEVLGEVSSTLDGSERLKSLLRVPPPAAMHESSLSFDIQKTRSPQNHKADVLLEIAKASNPLGHVKSAVTPLEQSMETPVLPISVTEEPYVHHPRQQPSSKVNSRPKVSLGPSPNPQLQTHINSGQRSRLPSATLSEINTRTTNTPVVSPCDTLNSRLPYKPTSSTPFNTHSSVKLYQHNSIPHQHPVDAKLEMLPQENLHHGPSIPPASQLPQPKQLPADKSVLLSIFMSSRKPAETKPIKAPSGSQSLHGPYVHRKYTSHEESLQGPVPAGAVTASGYALPFIPATTPRENPLVSRNGHQQEQHSRSEVLPHPSSKNSVLSAGSAPMAMPVIEQSKGILPQAARSPSPSRATTVQPKTILQRKLQEPVRSPESVREELAVPKTAKNEISTHLHPRVPPLPFAIQPSTPPQAANALLELFKTPSESERARMALPSATLAPPNAPIELSAQPSPGRSREPSSSRHTLLRGTRRRGVDDRFSVQTRHELSPHSKNAAVSATVTGPLDIPHFEAIRQFKESKPTRSSKRPSVSPEIRQASPVRILKRPVNVHTPPRSIQTSMSRTATSKPTNTKANLPEQPVLTTTEGKLFQPQMLRRLPQPQTSPPEADNKIPTKVGIPPLSSLLMDRRTNRDPRVAESLLSLFGGSPPTLLAGQSLTTHTSPVSVSTPHQENAIVAPSVPTPSRISSLVPLDGNGANVSSGQKTPGTATAIDKNFLLGFLAGQT